MRRRVKPAGRRSEQAAASRERILDAAVELFSESGYDGTPTARIAERAEIPKGLVFHYFPTKRDVLVAVVAERSKASTHPEVRRRLTQLHAEALRRVRRAIDAALEGTRVRPPSQPQRDAAAAAFTSALLHDLHLHQLTGHAIDLRGIAALIARGLQAPALAVTG